MLVEVSAWKKCKAVIGQKWRRTAGNQENTDQLLSQSILRLCPAVKVLHLFK